MEKSPEEQLKREKAMKTARTVWMILIPIFGALALFNLYRWTQGRDGLPSFLSQSGMALVGLAIITGSRSKQLSYVFTVLGMIAVVAGLVMVIMSLLD
jgi:UDP-N-acetylmuramyl pentapeptide phosphotransferase/UDP-N-acetylglucosamine-1-phosphate transferase